MYKTTLYSSTIYAVRGSACVHVHTMTICFGTLLAARIMHAYHPRATRPPHRCTQSKLTYRTSRAGGGLRCSRRCRRRRHPPQPNQQTKPLTVSVRRTCARISFTSVVVVVVGLCDRCRCRRRRDDRRLETVGLVESTHARLLMKTHTHGTPAHHQHHQSQRLHAAQMCALASRRSINANRNHQNLCGLGLPKGLQCWSRGNAAAQCGSPVDSQMKR